MPNERATSSPSRTAISTRPSPPRRISATTVITTTATASANQ